MAIFYKPYGLDPELQTPDSIWVAPIQLDTYRCWSETPL